MTTTLEPPDSPVRRTPRGTHRVSRSACAIALVFVVGVAVVLYPTAASWFTQLDQSRRIDDLTASVRHLGAAQRAEALRDAEKYNRTLSGHATVAAHERLPRAVGGSAAADGAYDRLLRADSGGLMARIKIPSIDVDLPVYHGTGDRVLREGVGHLEQTALPVGGASTHAVLTGHRGLAGATLFTRLDEVHVGDTFTIEVFGRVLVYRVRQTKVVDPADTDTLFPEQGSDLVTLITCTPLGINSQRILVTGERVTPTPAGALAAAGRTPDVPGFPWWAVVAAGSVAASAGYVRWASGPVRRRREPR